MGEDATRLRRTNEEQSASLASSSKIVLFVCVENTFRSVLSEALFNASPPEGWRAESASVRAADSINPVVVGLLKEIGIELGPKKPRMVTPEMIARASRVITFGCLDQCPVGAKDKSDDWPLPGATGKSWSELQAIRDELRRRIDLLKGKIAAEQLSAETQIRRIRKMNILSLILQSFTGLKDLYEV